MSYFKEVTLTTLKSRRNKTTATDTYKRNPDSFLTEDVMDWQPSHAAYLIRLFKSINLSPDFHVNSEFKQDKGQRCLLVMRDSWLLLKH